jgi:hypothetical protein
VPKIAALLLSFFLLLASSFNLLANNVQLNWNPSTDIGGTGVAGFNVYRNGLKIGTSSMTTYTDTTGQV